MSFLETVGKAVRAQRERRGLTRKALAAASGVSERFLAQLEVGDGNISLRRFADVAHALGVEPHDLLTPGPSSAKSIALLGLRGAGKSTIGAALAKKLGVPFVEADREIELSAGLSLGNLFALHGEAYYRRLEREVLSRLLADPVQKVIATGGPIVNDPTTYRLLRGRAHTVWLRANAEDHWNRVVAQGDQRPMAENPHAFAELRALLAAREKLYAQADVTIDTSARTLKQVVAELAAATPAAAAAPARRGSPS